MTSKNILAISTFPAPYRVKLFQLLAEKYDVDLYFEISSDQNRNKEWFATSEEFAFTMLDCNAGREKYRSALRNIGQYDMVFLYDYWTSAQMRLQLLCRMKKIPFVLNCDGALPAAFASKNIIKDTVKKFFIKNADAYMAGGENAKKYFVYYGADPRKIVVHNFSSMHKKEIENIADMRLDKRAGKASLNLPDKKIVLAVGQFIERKGFDVLIRAWVDVRREDAYLLMIGGGDLEHDYQALVKSENITNAQILGYKSPEQLKKYYCVSDLFVLPTREDIWGLVINEAMAYGLPVITTTSCGAGLELIEDGKNGKLVSVGDTKCLAEALENFLECDPDQLENIARMNKEKISHYSLEYMASKHEEVIEHLSDRNMRN